MRREGSLGGWIWSSLCLVAWCLSGNQAEAITRYVPNEGTLDQVLARVINGDTVVVRAGNHRLLKTALLSKRNDVTIRGEPGAIVYSAVPTGTTAALRLSSCNRVEIADLTIEGAFQTARGIKVDSTCSFVTIRNCEVTHCGNHGIDIDSRDSTIKDCRTHHNLAFPGGVRADAHGMVTAAAQRLLIEGCTSYCNSGDSFQADRGAWNEVTLRNCDLYDEPLTAQVVNPFFNGAFPNPTLPLGQTVSENAIDTKHVSTSRGILRLQDLRMRGYTMTVAPTFNASALVLKENVDVIAERCRTWDCEIGWRVRSLSNSMQCKLDMVNCWTNNCLTGFRLEDALSGNPQQIRLAHNTFDANTTTLLRAPSTANFFGDSMVCNTLVLNGTRPTEFPTSLGNTATSGARGIDVPAWASVLAQRDLLLNPRPAVAPVAGAIETAP
ncbi:MAG: right-handed parallel beta-helix repeat-containing protein [Planctomycetaceae bacterium]